MRSSRVPFPRRVPLLVATALLLVTGVLAAGGPGRAAAASPSAGFDVSALSWSSAPGDPWTSTDETGRPTSGGAVATSGHAGCGSLDAAGQCETGSWALIPGAVWVWKSPVADALPLTASFTPRIVAPSDVTCRLRVTADSRVDVVVGAAVAVTSAQTSPSRVLERRIDLVAGQRDPVRFDVEDVDRATSDPTTNPTGVVWRIDDCVPTTPDTCATPTIDSVVWGRPGKEPNATISGRCFGPTPSDVTDSASFGKTLWFSVVNLDRENWEACHAPLDLVTCRLAYTRNPDGTTTISLPEFSDSYAGNGGQWQMLAGNRVRVHVWNSRSDAVGYGEPHAICDVVIGSTAAPVCGSAPDVLAPTVTTLRRVADRSVATPATLVATVRRLDGTPATGSVLFLRPGGGTLATADLDSAGVATARGVRLPVGRQQIVAEYQGARGIRRSRSAPIDVTVRPLALTVVPAASRIYGTTSNAFTFQASAVDGVTVGGALTCTTINGGRMADASLNVGRYRIVGASCGGLGLGGPRAADYAVAYANGDLVVRKAPITVTTSSTSRAVSLLQLAVTYTTTVRSAVTGRPIAGVPVRVQPSGRPASAACDAVTDRHGVATCRGGLLSASPDGGFTASVPERANYLAGSAQGSTPLV